MDTTIATGEIIQRHLDIRDTNNHIELGSLTRRELFGLLSSEWSTAASLPLVAGNPDIFAWGIADSDETGLEDDERKVLISKLTSISFASRLQILCWVLACKSLEGDDLVELAVRLGRDPVWSTV